jgi:hypothetical protein
MIIKESNRDLSVKIKRTKLLLYLYYAIGFVFLVLFIPKNSFVIGLHSLIVSVVVFLFFFIKNKSWLPNLFENVLAGFKSFVVIMSAFIVFILFTVGHLLAINGLMGKQENICFKGEIINKFEDTSRFDNVNYYVEFIPEQLPDKEEVRVSLEEYRSYKIGDEVKKSWRKGILGYIHLSALGSGPGTVRYKGCS